MKTGSCISASHTLKMLNMLVPMCPRCLMIREMVWGPSEERGAESFTGTGTHSRWLSWGAGGPTKAISLTQRDEAEDRGWERWKGSPFRETEVSVNQSLSIQHTRPPPAGLRQAVPAAWWRHSGSLGFLKHLLVPLRMRSKSTLALLGICFSTLTPATTAKFFCSFATQVTTE